MYIDEAKKVMKSHFIALGDELTSGKISAWVGEGSYPFEASDSSKERDRFDKLAIELSERMESFAELSPTEHRIVFRLLKRAMATLKRGGLKEFLK